MAAKTGKGEGNTELISMAIRNTFKQVYKRYALFKF